MRKIIPILSLFLTGLLLPACGSGGAAGPGGQLPAAGMPEYVEAGFFIYDGALEASMVPEAFSSELIPASSPTGPERLERLLNPRLGTSELPPGYRVQLRAYWKGVPGAERYRIYVREAGGSATEIGSTGGNESELTIQDLLPQFGVVDGRAYEVGVAAVISGREQRPAWSWPLTALGGVHLTAPVDGSSQPARPTFVWSNARGNPTSVQLDLFDSTAGLQDSGFWDSAPLPATITPSADLKDGAYFWTVTNGASSQAATDARTRRDFPHGYMVLTMPGLARFTVGSGGGGSPGDGGGAGGSVSGTLTMGAGGDLNGTLVVACFLAGSQCDEAKSAVTQITAGGTEGQFSFSGLAAGEYAVYAFKDMNGNNIPDDGDWYGEAAQTVTPPASGLLISMQVIGGAGGPPGGDGGGGGTGGEISGTVIAPAGGDPSDAVVFACYIAGAECDQAKSDVIMVGGSGTFSFPNLAAGQYYIWTFKDINGNGEPDAGDWYAEMPNPVTPPATGLELRMQVFTPSGAGR